VNTTTLTKHSKEGAEYENKKSVKYGAFFIFYFF